jgi:hypothetical protein
MLPLAIAGAKYNTNNSCKIYFLLAKVTRYMLQMIFDKQQPIVELHNLVTIMQLLMNFSVCKKNNGITCFFYPFPRP